MNKRVVSGWRIPLSGYGHMHMQMDKQTTKKHNASNPMDRMDDDITIVKSIILLTD